MSSALKPPSSPCTKVCTLDPQRGLCAGCCRTLVEIAAWGGMSEPDRQRIMDALPARRGELETPRVPDRR